MDIDEMKKSWAQLNDRLEEREKLNHEVIRKLLADKAVSGYDRIRSKEKSSLLYCIFLAIILPVMYIQGIITYWYSVAIVEAIIFGGIAYLFYLLRRMPKPDDYKNGIVNLIKENAKYQKLYSFSTPVFIVAVLIIWIVFICSIEKGFQNDTYHQVIFYGSIVLIIIVATYGYKKIKSKLDQINQDLEELRKFEQESDQGKED